MTAAAATGDSWKGEEAGIIAAQGTSILDYFIGPDLGQQALRVVLASNADNAAVLFRLRLVARRFHSELPKHVARLNFSGLNVSTLSDGLLMPFSALNTLSFSASHACEALTGMPKHNVTVASSKATTFSRSC